MTSQTGFTPTARRSEPSIYFNQCGTTLDANESGGTLTLTSPSDNCPFGLSATILTSFLVPSEAILRATFKTPGPALDENYGIGFSANGDIANLQLQQNEFGIFIGLHTDEDPFGTTINAEISPETLAAAAAIEFMLELTLDSDADVLIPSASYRLCTSSPCEATSTTPFIALGAFPAGSLAAGISYLSSMYATTWGAMSQRRLPPTAKALSPPAKCAVKSQPSTIRPRTAPAKSTRCSRSSPCRSPAWRACKRLRSGC